jgi:CDP-glycerol glycerophosphotransferase (TagB/SpsB family)
MTGLSDVYQTFCVASEGFKELFIRKGVDADKIVVTGIPNFDNVQEHINNDFPYKNYVLAATSHLRESLKYENRKKFIHKALSIADGRRVIFKLHPNENKNRAFREINKYAPNSIIFSEGNTNHMIANCDALVTKYSSVLLVALALGKPVYTDIDEDLLQKLKPIQNNGKSSKNIANICINYLN